MDMLIKIILFNTTLLYSTFLFSQKVVFLDNPSFEGIPGVGNVPPDWESLGGASLDTHPDNMYLVEKYPQDGKSYIGLVTSSENTYGGIGQYVSPALLPNTCYHFSIFICRSTVYAKRNSFDTDWVNHHNPVQLEIWGGIPNTPKNELLAKTEGILNTNWIEYHFKISPQHRHKYISLEAHFIDGSKKFYDGNILLDAASHFKPISCSQEIPALDFEKIKVDPVPSDEEIILKYEMQNEEIMENPEKDIPTFEKTLSTLWEYVQFFEGTEELTDDALEILPEIADELPFWGKSVTVVVVKGEGELKDNRVKALKEALLDTGLSRKFFSIKPVYPSDLSKEYLMKNDFIWVRCDD